MQPDWRARLALIFLIACFYAGFVLINNELLIFWAADTSYRYWFYPPAGVRLVIIMLFGWQGVVGYFLAALALLSSGSILEVDGFDSALFVAVGRALSLWLGLLV